jgi:hypothetical protein
MSTVTNSDCCGLRLIRELWASDSPKDRIRASESPEDRIRKALGTLAARLPEVTGETLQAYYRYLKAAMVFPFQARYPEAAGIHGEVVRKVTALELLDPAVDFGGESLGLVCRVRKGKTETELPLADLEVDEDSPNYQLIEDYWYWFWNWR